MYVPGRPDKYLSMSAAMFCGFAVVVVISMFLSLEVLSGAMLKTKRHHKRHYTYIPHIKNGRIRKLLLRAFLGTLRSNSIRWRG